MARGELAADLQRQTSQDRRPANNFTDPQSSKRFQAPPAHSRAPFVNRWSETGRGFKLASVLWRLRSVLTANKMMKRSANRNRGGTGTAHRGLCRSPATQPLIAVRPRVVRFRKGGSRPGLAARSSNRPCEADRGTAGPGHQAGCVWLPNTPRPSG